MYVDACTSAVRTGKAFNAQVNVWSIWQCVSQTSVHGFICHSPAREKKKGKKKEGKEHITSTNRLNDKSFNFSAAHI